MGKLAERTADIARRCGDLSPLAAPVRDIIRDGNKEAVLAGLSPDGRRVKDLAPSTLKRRKGDGPPRAPRREASRVIAGLVVVVDAGPGRLTFTQTWPDFPEVEYLDLARPTFGYSAETLDKIRAKLREHVIPGA